MNEVGKSQAIEMKSMSDLIRLIVSNSAQRGGFLYLGIKDGKNVFYISHVVPSWYDLKGLPVVIFAYHDVYPDENFVSYTRPGTSDPEKWEFVNNIHDNDPKRMFVPIVKVKEIPSFTF